MRNHIPENSPAAASIGDSSNAVGAFHPKYGIIETKHKWYAANPRVWSLLRKIAADGIATETYRAYSDTSRGEKNYTRYIGKEITALRKIQHAFQKRWFAKEEESPSDAYLPMYVPSADEIVDHMRGRFVDYRGEGSATSKADYLAMCDEALALAGLARRQQVAA